MQRRLEPRRDEEYFVVALVRYTRANPIPVLYVVIICLIVLSAVLVGITADAAHTAGVATYGG